jgi:hypothetical protein
MTRELMWHDLERCLRRCPTIVLELLKRHAGLAFIAGGFVRACVSGEEISDIDIFASEKEQAEAWAGEIRIDKSAPLWRTPNAITVCGQGHRYPVQFIHRWTFSNPFRALNSFDFTISKAAFWADPQLVMLNAVPWKSACDERFYADLAAKRLIYTSPIREEEPGGSLLRVLKFYQRGYRIPLNSLGAVVGRCIKGVDFEHLPQRKREPSHKPPYTREQAIAVAVTQLLREVDPEIDPNHIAHLPSDEEEGE